jgi:hypothetical protein
MPSEKSGRSKRNAFSSAIMSFVRQYGGKRITVQEVARAIALKNILQVVS